MKGRSYICAVCGKAFSKGAVIPSEAVGEEIAREIAGEHPNWSLGSFICRADLMK